MSFLPPLDREEVVQNSTVPDRHSDGPPNKSRPPSGGLVLRNAVVEEARTWLSTPFHHGQRCKGAGVDCGQLLLGVYHNVGCIPRITTEYYPADFHLHNSREWYLGIVQEWCDEIWEKPKPGDVVLYKLDDGLVYSHGVIVTNWPEVIHAYIRHRKVEVGDGEQGWLGAVKDRRYFRPRCLID